MDHLDMIDLVRITSGSITTLKKFGQFFADRWSGFLSVGVDEATAAEIIMSCHERKVAALTFVQHEIKPDHLRLPYNGTIQLRAVLKEARLSAEDSEFVLALARDKGNLEVRDEAMVAKLEEAIAASPLISKVRTWWDQIPDYPSITSAGITVAYANSRRYHQFEKTRGLAEYLEYAT
jgi:hypothetical protein